MKRLNFNIKDRKVLTIGLCLILVCVFTLTVAYAALGAVLNISGSAQVSSAEWNVHFDNIKVKLGSVSGDEPRITSPTTATFSTVLNMPGDFYEFTIDVVNDGSIDAMIENITKTPTLSESQAKYLKYDITYQNGESITTRQLVEKNSFVRLKVRLEYRSDITASDLPKTSETLTLGLKLDYIQSDGSGSVVVDNGKLKVINVISGNGTNTSDEICIGEECFYVMYSDEESVTMLSKYNLYVGGERDTSAGNTWTPYGDEASGIQDETMKGFIVGQAISKGVTPFSNTNYWSSTVSSYPAYVYDSNSTLYSYVENYKTYLTTLGVIINEARLITIEELTSLGCASSSCYYAPSWVSATSYWTGTAYNTKILWNVDSGKGFYSNYPYNNHFGVRPVIVISKDYIPKETISFTINGFTYQAKDGMTWEEWVNSEYNTINAYVNGEFICLDVVINTLRYNSHRIDKDDVIDGTLNYRFSSDGGSID